MVHTETVMTRLPSILKREDTLERYVEAHDLEFDDLETDLDAAIDKTKVENATGKDLDQVGAIFGELGKRRGRSDNDYRVYLKSVVDSFNGRGSVSGLKFAIASAVDSDTDNIIIDEDFENLEYDIQIINVDTSFISAAINDLAELADPSVVKLDEAIIIAGGEEVLIDNAASSVSDAGSGLGSGTLTLDGNSTLGP